MAEVNGAYFFARKIMDIPGTVDDILVLCLVIIEALRCRKAIAARCPYPPFSPTGVTKVENAFHTPLIHETRVGLHQLNYTAD